jgi:hypothetical protein
LRDRTKVIAILTVIIVLVASAIALAINSRQQYAESLRPQLPIARATLESYGLTIVETNDFTRTNGFSASLTFIKFTTPESFAEFCISKNVTSVMHYYGNMLGNSMGYDYFYFIEGETVYRYVIE